MTAAVESLYILASERSFHPYLDKPRYRYYLQKEEMVETTIEQFLPGDKRNLLDDLRKYRYSSSGIEQEAAFQAGLAIGLELPRL